MKSNIKRRPVGHPVSQTSSHSCPMQPIFKLPSGVGRSLHRALLALRRSVKSNDPSLWHPIYAQALKPKRGSSQRQTCKPTHKSMGETKMNKGTDVSGSVRVGSSAIRREGLYIVSDQKGILSRAKSMWVRSSSRRILRYLIFVLRILSVEFYSLYYRIGFSLEQRRALFGRNSNLADLIGRTLVCRVHRDVHNHDMQTLFHLYPFVTDFDIHLAQLAWKAGLGRNVSDCTCIGNTPETLFPSPAPIMKVGISSS